MSPKNGFGFTLCRAITEVWLMWTWLKWFQTRISICKPWAVTTGKWVQSRGGDTREATPFAGIRTAGTQTPPGDTADHTTSPGGARPGPQVSCGTGRGLGGWQRMSAFYAHLSHGQQDAHSLMWRLLVCKMGKTISLRLTWQVIYKNILWISKCLKTKACKATPAPEFQTPKGRIYVS